MGGLSLLEIILPAIEFLVNSRRYYLIGRGVGAVEVKAFEG